MTIPVGTEPAASFVPGHDDPPLLARLESIASGRGMATLADRLAELRAWIGRDVADVEDDLRALDARGDRTPAVKSALHLLSLEGKRLRPMCVALASRVGSGFGPTARALAVAVELVHNATLLHDDVVDMGDTRRGVPAARVVYGNAASVFGGDWLLVEAIVRIRSTGIPDVLDRALGVLNEMLLAESLQLANRGTLRGGVADYFRVIEGKTASLFRWALYAGGRAGGVSPEVCTSLETFGQKLGVAFQVVDDVLDVSGDASVVGKTVFADLREGKMTYPLLLAVEREPGLGTLIEQACQDDERDAPGSTDISARVAQSLRATHAVDDCLAAARRLSAEALAALANVPPSRARDALEDVAVAMLHRNK